MQQQLVVLARWPAAGRCKRRLAASCGSTDAAARVQAALTRHTLAVARAWAGSSGTALTLAVDGLGPLGCRMQRQLQRGFNGGAERVVLIGSDLPQLERGDLRAAFRALRDTPLVLGPARDGGYWLIGCTRAGFELAGAALMSGISWGSNQVLVETERQAATLALPVTRLRQQNDLDNRDDLLPWLRRTAAP